MISVWLARVVVIEIKSCLYKMDFETNGIAREKEGPSNLTSGYLSKQTHKTTLKRPVHLGSEAFFLQ